jgi:hypothetical protein
LKLCGSELSRDRERARKKYCSPKFGSCPAKGKSDFGFMNPLLETKTRKEKRFD